jgi:general secretion pathway protein K
MAFDKARQQGVAVVTALLLTTLAVSIVASLFWEQQVQVRAIENQRLQLQKQWILRGALDWARLILREDARFSKVDSLDEPWAVPLSETRLDQYVENGRTDNDASDASLSGQMVDAQSLYNLTNMCPSGAIVPIEVDVFARLLASLRLNPELAKTTAALMAKSYPAALTATSGQNSSGGTSPGTSTSPGTGTGLGTGPSSGKGTNTSTLDSDSSRQLRFTQVDDLLSVPGFTPEAVEKLRNLVIFLPRTTSLNLNTAPAEVIAARIEKISVSDAKVIVAGRKTAAFRDLADLANRLPGIPTIGSTPNIDIASSFFLVNGRVKLGRAVLQTQALIERTGGLGTNVTTRLVWMREN